MSIKPKLIDVHTHTHFAAYENDSAQVIERAISKDIWIVNVGTQKDTSALAVKTANKYSEGVYATVGLHPIHTDASHHDKQELGITSEEAKEFTSRGEEFDYDNYKKLALNNKVVAIGECGLDYYRIKNSNSIILQKEIFSRQIELSFEVKKPLMIHCRSAFRDLIDLLNSKASSLNNLPGIIHFFSGSLDDAKELLELGFRFSFGGVVTFTNDYDDVVKYIPVESVLLETDAPYVSPVPHRGKRNEPMYIEEVAKKIAELKNMNYDELARQTTSNAIDIFKITI